MTQFKVGDIVRTSDFEHGVITKFNECTKVYVVKIGNKLERWFSEGLSLVHDPEIGCGCPKCDEARAIRESLIELNSKGHGIGCACDTCLSIVRDAIEKIEKNEKKPVAWACGGGGSGRAVENGSGDGKMKISTVGEIMATSKFILGDEAVETGMIKESKEPMFKVGNRVKLKNGNGQEGIICEIYSKNVRFVKFGGKMHSEWCDIDDLELLNPEPEFKVGDKVYVEGTIRHLGSPTDVIQTKYLVIFDNYDELLLSAAIIKKKPKQ